MALDRQSILSKLPNLPREEIDVPEWGGKVWVRTLSASERDQLEIEWEKTKRVHFRARLAYYCVCDETGADLFRAEDVAILGAHSTTALSRVADVAFRLNRFTSEDVEALEKN